MPDEDEWLWNLPCRDRQPIQDRVLWERGISEAKFAVLPNSTTRPNPLVVDGLVVASCATPGGIHAFNAETGEHRWAISMGRYADSHVIADNGVVYGGSGSLLIAIRAVDGQVLWHRPVPHSVSYCDPTVSEGHLYRGDTNGFLMCFDVKDGSVLWAARPSRSRRNRVNTAPAVWRDLVISSTVDGLLFALNRETGSLIWKRQLAYGISTELQQFGHHVVVRSNQTIYVIDPATGDVVHRWTSPGKEVAGIVTAGDRIIAWITPRVRMRDAPPGYKHPKKPDELLAFRPQEVLWRRPQSPAAYLSRWDKDTGLLYENTFDGIGILDPVTGERLHLLTSGFPSELSEYAIPSVTEHYLYLLEMKGSLLCVSHP